MKKTLLLFLLLPFFGFAQTTFSAGTYHINSGSSVPYLKSLSSAITELTRSGSSMTGPVIFSLDQSQALTSQITIAPITGSSATNTLTIKPSDNVSNISISGSIGNGAVIALNGADNIVIDGDNKLTIFNSLDDTSYTNRAAIWLHSGADNNIFKNLTVQLKMQDVTIGVYSTGIYAGSNTIGNSANNSNNTINNVTFKDVKQGIIIKGSNQSNTNWTITNNKIGATQDPKPYVGVYIQNVSTYNVSSNTIIGVKMPSNIGGSIITHSGILLETANSGIATNNIISDIQNGAGHVQGFGICIKGNNSVISKNTISNLNSSSSSYGSFGIRSEGNDTQIYNNKISSIFCSDGKSTAGIYTSGNNQTIYNNYVHDVASAGGGARSTQDGFGIYINNGTTIKLYHNSVRLSVNQTNGSSAPLYIKDGSALDIRNNLFINAQTSGSLRFAIYTEITDFTKFTFLNNNNYKSTQFMGCIGDYNTIGNRKTALADWRGITNTDAASTEKTPLFTNGTLDLDSTNSVNTTLIGTTDLLSTVLNDIYGRLRTSPNIGAHEISPCIPTGTQTTFGNNSWIGYVYKWTGSTPNPTYADLPGNDNVVYIGTVTEPTIFDRTFAQSTVTGVTTSICGVPPSSKYLVRYKMSVTTEAGEHLFEVGGDDGTRLYIDGKLVIERWNDHGYTKDQLKYTLTAGPHEFVLDYYQNAGGAQVSFSYGLPKGNPNDYGDNVWNVYGYNASDISLPVANYAGMYVDPVLNFSTETYWAKGLSPSYYSGWQGVPMPINYFAFAYKRRGFPCGNYQLELPNYDDDVQILINGVQIFQRNGYSPNRVVVNPGTLYFLNQNSTIEVRVREDAGDANLALDLIDKPSIYNGADPISANSTSIRISSDTYLSTDIEVCSCIIDANATLTVQKNKTLTVTENIINNGKLVIENDGSLLQTNIASSAYQGAQDSFNFKRNTQPVRRYDFTYWSSPVKKSPGFTMHDLSPNTLSDKYNWYVAGATASGWVFSVGGGQEMIPAVGYTIRAPQSFSITEAVVYPATFIGIPNNGPYKYTPQLSQWNLVGNPYPSAIEADKFISINHNSGLDVGALYFWTHNSPPVSTTGETTSSYSSNDYAIYSLTGSTRTQQGAAGTSGNIAPPSGYIAAGVSFFIQPVASSVGSNRDVQFSNAMRIAGNNTQFFKTTESNTVEKNRLWLNLTNSEGAFKQTLVGYVEGATNDWDTNYDATTMAGNSFIDFYSINGAGKLTIQGRAVPFDETDRVPLGYKTTVAGEFTIAIDKADGLFTTQTVYLEDKTTGYVVDLSAKDYTFKTEIGTFIDRFTISYTKKSLGTGDFETLDNSVLVSVNAKAIKVTSTKETIGEVTIYDITGKTLYNKKKVGAAELQIPNLQSGNQVLLVKVTLENDYSTTKKIIFQ